MNLDSCEHSVIAGGIGGSNALPRDSTCLAIWHR